MKESMRLIFASMYVKGLSFSDKYYIAGDKNDCDLLTHGIILEKNIQDFLPYLILVFQFQDKKYLLVLSSVSFGSEIGETENLIEVNLTPGMIALFFSEVKPKRLSSVTEDFLSDSVFYPIEENNKYCGHDANIILNIFGSIKAFQIRDPFLPNIHNCLTDFLTQEPNTEKALGQQSHLSLIKECLVFSNTEIAEQMCHLLWIREFDIAFIKLYQLVELLYPIPYVKSVHSIILPKAHDIVDLLNILTENLDWRYIEITALEKLLKEIPLSDMPIIIGFESISDSENIYLKNAKIIYDIRCRIVHKRFKQKRVSFEIEQWHHLYDVLLKIIKFLYTKFSQIIEKAESC